MKLAEKYVEHIHGAVMMHLGSRNQALLPYAVSAWGGLVSPDRESLTIYVLEVKSKKILQNLIENGKFALTVNHPLSLETYQFKGIFVSSRPANPQDKAIQTIYNNKIIALLSPIYPHFTDRYNQMVMKPMVSITLKIDEIFEQTPGPGTGNKVPQ